MPTKEITVEVEVDEKDERIVHNNASTFVRNSLRKASHNDIEDLAIVDWEVRS